MIIKMIIIMTIKNKIKDLKNNINDDNDNNSNNNNQISKNIIINK